MMDVLDDMEDKGANLPKMALEKSMKEEEAKKKIKSSVSPMLAMK